MSPTTFHRNDNHPAHALQATIDDNFLGQKDNALRIALGSHREIQSYIWDSLEYEQAVMMTMMIYI